MKRICRRISLLGWVLVIWGLTACEQDQVYVQTRLVEAGQTAVVEGQQFVETEAAQIAETAAAELATRLASTGAGNWTIALDPGHGWQGDSGAIGNGLQEKDVTLDIAFPNRAILESQGFQVFMTRSGDDPDHDLSYAVQLVNQQNADLAVSIHVNAGGGTGTEACHTVGKATDAQSKILARLLTGSIAQNLALFNRGIFPENDIGRCGRGRSQLYIHDMNPPAVIIETAFIDNPSDAELFRTRQQDIALAIATAITSFIESTN